MRWLLLALPLAAACSSDPVPVDSGPADVGPVQVDIGADVVDVPAVPHDQGADSGAVDAVAVVDAPAVDVVDAGVADAGSDAVAVGDAVDVIDAGVADAVALEDVVDVQLVDVAADRPDVVAVDVPRDAGPVDGGPVVYDLEAVRAGLEVRLAFTELGFRGSRTVCDAPSTPSCAVRSGEVNFFLNGCFGGNGLTGRITTGTGSRSGALDFNGQYLPTLRITSGPVRGARQSFHVQFAGPVSGALSGAEGIPGRTVDSALGDLWLLGCQVE